MKILGVVMYADSSIAIVMDVLKGGDLRTFLRENRSLMVMTAEVDIGIG